MRMKSFAALAAVAGAMTAGGAWAQGTVTIAVPTMPTGYAVVGSAGLSDILATNLVGEGLVRWKKNALEVEPALATAWTANENATVWTFKLREGVKWHDGTPFTAEDVKFTFDTIADRAVRSVTAGQIAGYERTEVISPTEVRMVFARPFAALPFMLAYRMPIKPRHALAGQDLNAPTDFIRKPLGTGAFRFASAASGQSWTVERNPDWWGGAAKLDRVVLRVAADANSTVAQLRTGALDISLIQPQQMTAVKAGGDVTVSAVDQPTVYYISLLNNKEPFTDANVRKALNYAVDKEGIIRAVVDGQASVAVSPIAPSVEGYTADLTVYPYDPEKAKAMLAEAGWTVANGKLQKDGKPMQVELTTSTGVIGGPQLAQIVQQQLQRLGIDSTINMVDFRELWGGLFAGRFQTSVEYLGLAPTADVTNAFSCKGGQNRFAYCNPKVDALLAEASATADAQRRNASYREVQKILAEDPPGIWLYFPKEVRAINARVADFSDLPWRMATARMFDVSVKR